MSPKAQRKSKLKANEAWLQAAWKEKGKAAPKQFQEELDDAMDVPELSWLEQQYLQVFNMAATCRPSAFGGVAPLPYLVVAEVLDRNGYVGEDFRTAMYVIGELDKVVVEHYSKEK
jgi:hypothetical protein